MRQSFFDTALLSAPAMPAALLISAGLSGGTETALVSLLMGTAALLVAGAFCIIRVPDATAVAVPLRIVPLRIISGLVLGVVVVAAGLLRVDAASNRFTSALPVESITVLQGRVLDDLRPGASPYRVIEVYAQNVTDRRGWQGSARGRVTVIWKGEEYLPSHLRRTIPIRGDTVRITGVAGMDGAGIDGAGQGGAGQGTGPTVFTDSEQITVYPVAGMASFRRTARDAVRSRLARLERRGGAMIPALLLGDRSGLSVELQTAVRAAGASHVLALSGMHLGVLAVILHLGPGRLLSRRVRDLVILPVLFLYVWVAGWIPSLLRALVLIVLASVARIRGRVVPVPLLLARTVVAVGVIAPRVVGNIGFQLSLMALIGIVVLSPLLLDHLNRFLPRIVSTYVGVTVAAMIATGPISLSAFGRIYPAGIVLAGALSALVVIQMWCGLAFLVLAATPVAGSLLIEAIRLVAILIERVAKLGFLVPAFHGVSPVLITVGAASIVITAIVAAPLLVLRCRDEPRLDY